MSAPSFRRARQNETEKVISILSDAFADDPLTMWIFGSTDRLEAGLRILIQDIYAPLGLVLVDDSLSSASLWLPRGQRGDMSLISSLRYAVRMLSTGSIRSIRRGQMFQQVHKKFRPAPDGAYLFMVGVAPSGQGQGLGSGIIRAGMEQLANHAVPTTLETSKPGLVGYYQNLGFNVTNEVALAPGSPTVWALKQGGAA